MADEKALKSFSDLIVLLGLDQVPYHLPAVPETVELPAASGTLRGVALVKWQADQGVVQVVVPLIAGVPVEAHGRVFEGLARINHALAVPGFGMQIDKDQLYYRVAVPIPASGLMSDELKGVLQMASRVSSRYLACFKQILEGRDPEEAIDAVGGMPPKR